MKNLSTELLSSKCIWDKKVVLLRVDLNLSVSELKSMYSLVEKYEKDFSNIELDKYFLSRVRIILLTIQALLKKNAKIVILSHFKRPRGKVVPSMSLYNLFNALRVYLHIVLYAECKLIQEDIRFVDMFDVDTIMQEFKLNAKIVILENLRFSPEEEENSNNFAKKLAKMGNIYVNEAFSCSHRKHASIHAITKFLPSFAGLHFEYEVNYLYKLLNDQYEIRLAIIGGSKISTKIGTIIGVGAKVNSLLIAGAMANTFLVAKGYCIGSSFYESEYVQEASNILNSSELAAKITLPIDVIVSTENGDILVFDVESIPANAVIKDIGPKTIELFQKKIMLSHFIVWNGPVGVFEEVEFSKGCTSVAMSIYDVCSDNCTIAVISGGDTLASIPFSTVNNYKFNSCGVIYFLTAGGAFLELLEGKLLPGLSVLDF